MSPDQASQFLIHHRAFECVNDARFVSFEEAGKEAELKRMCEYHFGPNWSWSLVDLAQAVLN
ncbi:hypothetical protein [Ruegeria meonggei]|uniref:Uncharacterized protein n=1 Tax=Ruegeria meonggei TaxID=1446476 RepID=A0A1X6ZCH8_9RHOB|nr:hypothetical protein [Ruegeria meonggei]SLN47370.1 hypothetical protein RUM8411_02242 [Ruegeria meonggei]